MKVALMLNGQGRYVEECFPFIDEKIIKKYNPDVFCQLWWNKDIIENGYAGRRNNVNIKSNLPQIIDNLYKPKKLLVEDALNSNLINGEYEIFKRIPQLKYLSDRPHINHFLSQLLSLKNCTTLFNWAEYDFIIKWRYDSIPVNFPNLYDLSKNNFYPTSTEWGTFQNDDTHFCDIGYILPNDFYILTNILDFMMLYPDNFNHVYGGPEDFFAKQLKTFDLNKRMIKLSQSEFLTKIFDI